MKKNIGETAALGKLTRLTTEFRQVIRNTYEHRAMSCSRCKTPGACCLDEHFVNVRITRLEARGIRQALERLSAAQRNAIYRRVSETVRRYGLTDGLSLDKTYACPLFEKGTGCVVHDTAKPLPCIHHACYEDKEDLPPGELLDAAESIVARLNRDVYGRQQILMPLPVAVLKAAD